MKGYFKVWGILLVFCLGTLSGFRDRTSVNTIVYIEQGLSKQEQANTLTTYNSPQSIPSDNSVQSIQTPPVSAFKLPVKFDSALIRIIDQSARSVFLQYVFESHKLLISLRTSLFIFPFHYFW